MLSDLDYLLLIDIGSTYTKTMAIDRCGESIAGIAKAFTTVETGIDEGLSHALCELSKLTGIKDYSDKLACSSAAGGLKMVAVGLVTALTSEAAKMAALNAGGKLIKTYSYELNKREADEIYASRPDIILLSGGTDGGNKKTILHNAGIIANIEGNFSVVVAGNKSVADKASDILIQSGKDARICENVLPELNVLNIEPARDMIRQIFLERIVRAKGLEKVQQMVGGNLMPTPSAVLKAAILLSKGFSTEEGIGDLMVVDVGGATTDVFSICEGLPSEYGIIYKGLPEPFAKRTVEGDLGVRYNAASLMEAAGVDNLASLSGIPRDDVLRNIESLKTKPQILPEENERLIKLDHALAKSAVRLAVERHAGRINHVYTVSGLTFIQSGKDLGNVGEVIGTGGAVIHSKNPFDILRESLFDNTQPNVLKPKAAQFLLDKKYILMHMGLLSEKHPETALRIMKKELVITR